MPQPLKKGSSTNFSVDAMSQRPTLAKHIGIIAALWSYLDYQRAIFLAAVLRVEAHIAMSMYLSIESDGGKRAVLDAVLKETFPDLFDEWIALNKRIGGTNSERNDVIHGLWGICHGHPETLVREDMRSAASVHGAAVTDIHKMIILKEPQASHKKALEKLTASLESLREWDERDFEQVEGRIRERIEEFRLFAVKVVLRSSAL